MDKKTSGYFVSSWSGGKDSSLAFYYAKQKGLIPSYLLNMITENPIQELKKSFVKEQAAAINVPIIIKNTTWGAYEDDYIRSLKAITELSNVSTCVFGDIDVDAHKIWNENICDSCHLKAFIPLWQKDRQALMQDFVSLGFKAVINVVNTDYLDKSFLGRELNLSLIQEFSEKGIDICGENGEYHTIVTDGPIFSYPLKIKPKGIIEKGQYCYLDFGI